MSSNPKSGEVFTGGATTSQHIDAEDDDHFENTTFKLKRTRSLGLLDEFIDPSEQERIAQQQANTKNIPPDQSEQFDNDYAIVEDESPLSAIPLNSSAATTSTKSPSPVITLKSPEVLPHDDTDIMNVPERHVDYLSHQWDVFDISKSWRYVISKRKDVANSARLENASWRTWAQKRSNLKTISPEVVNWSKDSDVTWLYGPILEDDENESSSTEIDHKRETTATSAVAGDISIADKCRAGPKPILKKRTVQDMMISHLNLLKLQLATNRMKDKEYRSQQERIDAANDHYDHDYADTGKPKKGEAPPEYFDYDAISAKLNSQYKGVSGPNSANNSSVNLTNLASASTTSLKDRLNQLVAEQKASKSDKEDEEEDFQDEQEAEDTHTENETIKSPVAEESDSKKGRHIHFNSEVQQCIAIDEYESDDDYDDDSNDDDYYYDDDDEEEGYIYENVNDSRGDSPYDLDDGDDDDDDEEDEEGGFFLNVKSPTSTAGVPGLASTASRESNAFNDNTEDTESVSTSNSKMYRSIQLLPSTSLNYGSSDEESDDENPYTSSMSHNVNNNSSRGYDYYYDYNTVYTVDPNQTIYGTNQDSNKESEPDVVDVPDDITMGSNFDYEIIENHDFDSNVPVVDKPDHVVDYAQLFPQHPVSQNKLNLERLPISSLDNSAEGKFPKEESESESDLDEDTGLSISARNSSQSLAQLIFGNNTMTAASDEQHFPENFEPQPVSKHMSSVNPNHSSVSLSKQPHSSGSLSSQFFMESPAELTKNRESSSVLADQFFNSKKEEVSPPAQSSSPSSELQRKSSPLSPYINSSNAFLGQADSRYSAQPKKNTFLFDSDSNSEDEFVEDASPPPTNNKTSYASLSQIADENGIKNLSPEAEPGKKFVGQARGIANHFLGNWKQDKHDSA